MIFEKDDRIVFAGDSVTDMESVAPVGECSLFEGLGKGFVRIVDSLLGAAYPELNLRISIQVSAVIQAVICLKDISVMWLI